MTNLERHIAEWRKQMLAAGIQSPVPLEELETHLREEIEQQTRSGSSPQDAFELAVRQIGGATGLETEFKKISNSMEIPDVAKLAGLICLITSLAGQFVFCAPIVLRFAFASQGWGLIPRALSLTGWMVTVALPLIYWKYGYKLLPAIQNTFLRKMTGTCSFIAGMVWIRFALFHLPFGDENVSPLTLTGYLFLFPAEWAIIAIFGGIAYGLEKAAGQHRSFCQF